MMEKIKRWLGLRPKLVDELIDLTEESKGMAARILEAREQLYGKTATGEVVRKASRLRVDAEESSKIRAERLRKALAEHLAEAHLRRKRELAAYKDYKIARDDQERWNRAKLFEPPEVTQPEMIARIVSRDEAEIELEAARELDPRFSRF